MLPDPSLLLPRAKALAALDLIICPEWEFRFYSFNSQWAPGQQMASVRDGSGNDWFMIFDASGWTALKGLDHEFPAWSEGGEALSEALKAAFPTELEYFTNEVAFDWKHTSYAWFKTSPDAPWVRANDLTSFSELETNEDEYLYLLSGTPEDYIGYADAYFEVQLDLEIVTRIFALEPITADMVAALNPEVTLDQIAAELHDQIGYPR